jgi:hypothetical protein
MMRRTTVRSILSVLLLTAALAACSWSGNSGQKLKLLTHSPWKYERAGFGSDGDGIFNALDPRIAGCEKDNTVIFRKDGSGTLQEGAIKCKLSDPDSLPFLWSFQNNDSTIWFQDQYYKVQVLNDDRLVIYADQNLGGVTTRYTIVFRH